MDRVIRVTGRGKISVKPDTIRLNIDASKVCKEYGEAIKESAKETRVLRETMKKAGLDPMELKTVHFDIDSKYESSRAVLNNHKRKLVGYRYSHRLLIKFPNDNGLLGRVLYELANCDVKVEFSIAHTVKDTEAVKNELLGKAIEDSKIKAEVLSKSAGVSLGEVKTIDYSWDEMEIFSRPMGRLGLENLAQDSVESYLYRSASSGLRSYDIDIEAKDIDVQDTVTVVWEIK